MRAYRHTYRTGHRLPTGSRLATSRMVTSAKNGGGMWPKCGTCRHGCPYLYVWNRGPSHLRRGGSDRQNPPGLALSTNRDCQRLKRLTACKGHDYIAALGRTAALARWRVREAPHCLRGESSGQNLWPWRMYGRRRLWLRPVVAEAGVLDETVRFRVV